MKIYQRPRQRVFKLPRRPSQLIRLSLKDMRKAEKQDERFVLNMNNWHVPFAGGPRCTVCQAGAVMAMHLQVPDAKYAAPENFDWDTCGKLRAINLLRTGDVRGALRILGYRERTIHRKWPQDIQDKYLGITIYAEDREACYREQRALARALERRGL